MFELPNGLVVEDLDRGETQFLYREIFDRRTYLRHGVRAPSDGIVVDVGAHIGLSMLHFHLETGGLPVWGVEPAPKPFACLQSNVRRHGIDAKLFPVALGAKPGAATLTYYPENSIQSGLRADAVADRVNSRTYLANAGFGDEDIEDLLPATATCERISVEVCSLSSILARAPQVRVTLLKLDTERSEHDVLAGVADPDWPRIDQVVAEVHDVDGALAKVEQLLARRGFHVVVDQDPLLCGSELFMMYATKR